MKAGKVKAFQIKFKAQFEESESRRASILLGTQVALLPLLFATAVLVAIAGSSEQRVLYVGLIAGLLILMLASLAFNLRGKYEAAAWLATIAVLLGPWGSILLDKTVIRGDFVPIVYLALSILLCSVLLSEKATLIIALVQLLSLAALIFFSPELRVFNWLSLVVFVLFASVIAIISSFLSRKQMEQLVEQKSELQNDKVLLRDLSMKDSLTGLYNRRFMEETLEREISRAVRLNHSLGIIIADIDNFKRINDTFGHMVGDSVICEVADLLSGNIRSSDIACRLGGDEFVLVLPECSLIQAREIAEALRTIISKRLFRYGNADVGRVVLSFGIAAVPENGSSGDMVLKAADDALYAVKKDSRDGRKTRIY